MAEASGPSTRALTWASLLAHWAEFAAASRGLPGTSDGTRWKRAVPEIIGLQAVTFALAEAHELPGDEVALAQDRAEILIRGHAGALARLWHVEPLPAQVEELIRDAQGALAATRRGGVEFRVARDRLVAEHPAELVEVLMGTDLDPRETSSSARDASEVGHAKGFRGDLFLAAPGVAMMRTAPAAFIRGPRGRTVDDDAILTVRVFLGGKRAVNGPHRVPGLRQVYRQFDFGASRRGQSGAGGGGRGGSGWSGPVRDAIAAREDMVLPGQPLMVPVILAGELQPVAMAIRGMDQVEDLPVVVERGE